MKRVLCKLWIAALIAGVALLAYAETDTKVD